MNNCLPLRSPRALTLALIALIATPLASCVRVSQGSDAPPAVVTGEVVPIESQDAAGAVEPTPLPSSVAPPPVSREFRGVWVTPVWGSDLREWPSRDGLPSDVQKAELRVLLDRAKALGLNAIVLHVRTAGDAMYPTPLAPWSAFLSGRQGVPPEPYYDPLAFAIAEAHARGLQLHAWFNPFRAQLPNFAGRAAASHVQRARPEWIRRYGTQTWVDPGEPAARRAVLDAIVDVVRRYDVDGVHIDDYFYPYREKAPSVVTRDRRGRRVRRSPGDLPFPDDATWKRYGVPAGFTSRASWRRNNVDRFVEAMYREVKAEKPHVLVGISPFGIWRSGVPRGVTGLDAYGEIYADARKWWVEGWADYFAPQLYWELEGPQRRFRRLDAWWRTENVHGRHLWPGLHTAMVSPLRNWQAAEIPAQIDFVRDASRRDTRGSAGHVHFRLNSIREGQPLAGMIRQSYREPAVVPSSPWLGARRPGAPRVQASGSGADVAPGDSVRVEWWLLQLRTDRGWSSELHHGSRRRLMPRDVPWEQVRDVVVTPLSATGVAGSAGGIRIR